MKVHHCLSAELTFNLGNTMGWSIGAFFGPVSWIYLAGAGSFNSSCASEFNFVLSYLLKLQA